MKITICMSDGDSEPLQPLAAALADAESEGVCRRQ